MKRILPIALIITFLSCKKDNNSAPKYDPPPTISNIQVSSETVNGITHPKITFTLTIPDTAVVKIFSLFVKSTFSVPSGILKPKSGTYTITDIYNNYPAPTNMKTYTSMFVMADNSAIYNSSFDVN